MEQSIFDSINEKINKWWKMTLEKFEDSLSNEEKMAIDKFRSEVDRIISQWHIFWIH